MLVNDSEQSLPESSLLDGGREGGGRREGGGERSRDSGEGSDGEHGWGRVERGWELGGRRGRRRKRSWQARGSKRVDSLAFVPFLLLVL